MTGFGLTAPGTLPEQLRFYDTTRAPNHACAGLGADELCLHDTGVGAGPCHGDSGGAVLRLIRADGQAGLEMPLSLGWVSRAGSPAGCGQGPQIVVNRTAHEPWLRHQVLRVELGTTPVPMPRGTRVTAA